MAVPVPTPPPGFPRRGYPNPPPHPDVVAARKIIDQALDAMTDEQIRALGNAIRDANAAILLAKVTA